MSDVPERFHILSELNGNICVLERQINQEMAEGWIPVGPVVLIGSWLYQSMMLPEREPRWIGGPK